MSEIRPFEFPPMSQNEIALVAVGLQISLLHALKALGKDGDRHRLDQVVQDSLAAFSDRLGGRPSDPSALDPFALKILRRSLAATVGAMENDGIIARSTPPTGGQT